MNTTIIFNFLIPQIKRILGIKDISLWRKRWVKRIGKIVYHKKYTADDVVAEMKRMGMNTGSIVCVHSSMMQFYNYKGTSEELIDKILDVIGPDGTLVMPAFPVLDNIKISEFVFDGKKEKTGAGYLAETFRKYPGVLRSNNVHHSVCAIGKDADYLLKDHTNGINCWDEKSPWYRMCELNALVFNIGMPRSYIGTFHHCVEGILYKDYPYWAQFYDHNQTYRYIDHNGSVQTYNNIEGSLLRKTREKKVTKYFTKNEWCISKLSNLEIKVFYSRKALEKMINLGRKGISVYYIPSTKGFKFDNEE